MIFIFKVISSSGGPVVGRPQGRKKKPKLSAP